MGKNYIMLWQGTPPARPATERLRYRHDAAVAFLEGVKKVSGGGGFRGCTIAVTGLGIAFAPARPTVAEALAPPTVLVTVSLVAVVAGELALGFTGHPGTKPAIVEDLIMEFEEGPAEPGPARRHRLRGVGRPADPAVPTSPPVPSARWVAAQPAPRRMTRPSSSDFASGGQARPRRPRFRPTSSSRMRP